jgi:GT2 family glycosyltransferase
MSKETLFAFVTFGNLPFSQLAVKSLRETVTNEYDIFAVVGKPGDWATKEWLDEEGIPHIMHTENMGFPYSLNDIYDWAWKSHDYKNLIIFGNDIVFYPYAADCMIDLARDSNYEVISALQYDVKDLVNQFPEIASQFGESSYNIRDFSGEPWKKFTGYSSTNQIADMQLYDIQNLCLYKKSVFDRIGYTDVNFYPAYFVDNDYARRIVQANILCCSLVNARFFHFWSRTIHQESGGSNSNYFKNNKDYYRRKWGGDFGEERHHPDINITSRAGEEQVIKRWRSKR